MRYEPLTTRTPEFLGPENAAPFLPRSKILSDLVIGILDNGAWPKSPSYHDKGLWPIPRGWKGKCEKSESKSPRDDDSHGTHTSSTAAGSAVWGANFLCYAYRTARGIAYTARVATYKILWKGGSFSSDILAAIDKAIDDGVHILSLSLGPPSGSSPDYFEDTITIPAFAATERGILVSATAGNAGPCEASVSNVAPWFITVGAGIIDRDFPAYVTLGNGKRFKGVSGFYICKPLTDKLVPVVYGSSKNATYGVFCLLDQGEKIKAYLRSVANPTATIIQKGMKLGVQPSPKVAAFSSRGPNGVTPQLLKPDVIAPGVNILAAWTGALAPTELAEDKRRVNFNIISGTSMACPHVSGLAALIKSVHPKWSPAAIRSALMTTAYSTYKNGETIQDAVTASPATPFDFGAGHVYPVAALHPGLIYDASVEDCIWFLSASNYTKKQIKTVTKRNFDCD
ncbi:Peptidase S8, subtilisin-related [Parasponia andersonii]|uniref:Peptidase S8, subtilisin-related n=1 Tax=Parasponia andersonii TaxID=3476 RepID=A0A2P5A5M7_PARAD|nr:Peptidase S8, subtilisin-related [Parasponia andersonii]